MILASSAQLDGHVGLGDEGLHRALARDDLLDKLEVEPLGKQHAARAGDRDAHLRRADDLLRAGEEVLCRGADVGVVTLVVCVHQAVVVVDDGQLHRGGAHVDAQAQARVAKVHAVLGRELGADLL